MDAGAVLRCLHQAFEPYRHLFSEPGYLDTTLTKETVQLRLREMRVLVVALASGAIIGTVGFLTLNPEAVSGLLNIG